MLRHSATTEGFLYLHRGHDLFLAAAIPNGEPAEELESAVREWLRLAFDYEQSTQTASRSQPLTIEASLPFELLGIFAGVDGEVVLAGIAALKGTQGKANPIPSAIVTAVGESLLRAGDATGRVGLI